MIIRTTKKIDIHMTRGDTLAFSLRITGLDGDLESAFFSVGQVNSDIVIFQKSLGNGITKIGDGEYTVRVAPQDTVYMALGEYQYDLEIGANSDVFTPIKGILKLEYEVTEHEYV